MLPRPDDELDWRNPLIVSVPELLGPAECQTLIGRIEGLGPSQAPITTAAGFVMRPDVRNNDRVMFDDHVLAGRLFEAVRPHVPERLEGEWTLVGANERLRCYRYRVGQHFAPHFDGSFVRSRNERSLLTFLVYLNGCERGGSTRFPDHDVEVVPVTGSALVFNHHLLHEGSPVLAGVKYVVRSDLLYRRNSES
jgi:prolyl 4-hydroxylase